MDYYGHKLSNGVLFAYHLILDVPGGSSHLAYRRRVPLGHNPGTRVKKTHTHIVNGHIRSQEVTYLLLSDDCLPGLLSWIAARCEPLASLGS